MDKFTSGGLHQLARLYNVQTAYYDVENRRRQASVESLLAILRTMGAPVISLKDVPAALREQRQKLVQCIMEPVTVTWDGSQPLIEVCLPVGLSNADCTGYLETEDKQLKAWNWHAGDLPVEASINVEGVEYIKKLIILPESLPRGYHKFSLEIGASRQETLIISAPVRAYLPDDVENGRMWGVFIPAYALQTQNTMGSGDYSALGILADKVAESGGHTVATLPLMPAFLDEPFEPSPYAPVSRLLWNEFYIDINKVPEISASSEAQDILQSSTILADIEELRNLSRVDYRRLMALKRQLLEKGCDFLLSENKKRFDEFQEYIQSNPRVEDYARFRATMEKQHATWQYWPQRLKDGHLNEADYEEKSRLYHMYAQWQAYSQVNQITDEAYRRGVTLYFDLPVGTHPEGYDTWRERESFALGAMAGAPPDKVFTQGQNWMFPPLHPVKSRERQYRYFTEYIRHNLRNAGMLRIDHVMGMHRLFWIPEGMDAAHGVYVRYRADELYAISTLESHRNRSIIVGEDLGTVPDYVRPTMSRHGLQRMYIVHYELADNSSPSLHVPHRNVVAGMNTHDMPPFAAFCQGLDVDERLDLGLVTLKEAKAERKRNQKTKSDLIKFLRKKGWLAPDNDSITAVLKACLVFLSASRARYVLVNLEDLWQETKSQNVPSTDDENTNWCRKARYTLEEFCQLTEVRDTLKIIDNCRKKGRNERGPKPRR
jgi:4-alpha-glucanotransferase